MLETLVFISKIALYITALFGIGLSLHGAASIAVSRRWIVLIGVGLLIAIASRLALLNAQLAGSLAGAFSPDAFGWIWPANRLQAYAFVGGAGLLMVSSLVRLNLLMLLAAFTIATGFGLAGHTQGLEEPGLAPWLVIGHVLIAGFWIAAPFTLWPKDTQDVDATLGKMERFSLIALWCVPLLFVSGGWLLVRLTGSPGALFSTPYGQTLLLKLFLASAVLAIGAWNKFRVTKLVREAPTIGLNRLKRSLGADIFLFIAIVLSIAAATTLTGPGAS